MIYINLIIFLFLLISFNKLAYSKENIIEKIKEGKKIIFIRHAVAPGSGDPVDINLEDCKTQRNLNDEGIKQSKNIGNFFKRNNISIGKVLSSEWCRCKDTAYNAFKEYKTFDALNSFYDKKFRKNKKKQIKKLKKYIREWNSEANLVLITHYVVILEILGVGVSSGEIIITNKNYDIIERINIF